MLIRRVATEEGTMELFIDECRVNAESVTGHVLEDALRCVQAELCSAGRMLVALRCDGEDIPATSMVATLKRPVSSFERIEVFTGTRKELVMEAMDQASASLTQTEAECGQVADCLTEGRTSAGMEILGRCMSVWQQIHDAVGKSIEMLQMDPVQTEINDERLIDVIAKPKEVLLQVKQALESQDHVLLADTLRYEFGDVTDQWHSLIARVRREAEDLQTEVGKII